MTKKYKAVLIEDTGDQIENLMEELQNRGFKVMNKTTDNIEKFAFSNDFSDNDIEISKMTQTELALRESEEKFRHLFHNLTDAVFVQETSQDGLSGKLIEVNDTACRMFGYTREELFKIKPRNLICKDSILDAQETIKNMTENSHATFEFKGITKDKKHINIEISSHKFKMKEKYILLDIVRDTTERIKVTDELKSNKTKYEYMIMNLNNAFGYFKVLTDSEGNPVDCIHVEVNEAFTEITGYKKEEILGKSILNAFPITKGTTDEFLGSLIRVSFTGGTLQINDFYLKNINKWCSLYAYSPEKGCFALVLTDITDQKNAEEVMRKGMEAAKAANRAKSEFLANMSHEIRTPLNGIVGMTNLTLMSDLSKQQKENLLIVKSSADALLNVINDILDFSKMEAGKLTIEKISFEVRNVLDNVIKAHCLKASEKGLELSCTVDSNVPKLIIGDPNRLQQIINNLLGNAIKFTETGNVKINVFLINYRGNSYKIKFSVIDTGIGIEEQDIGRLFKSFSQIDGAYTRRFGGTGLGLAITKQLVEMMGGSINVKSEKGKGSTFEFVLTMEDGEEIEKHFDDSSLQIKKSPSTLNILVVEDDKVNQTITSLMLKSMGHRTEIAENGKHALELYEIRNFDLILMDIQLPEMDGIQATKLIRSKEANLNKYTPIIAFTAYALKGDEERFLGSGMDGYIAKPFKIQELYSIIESIVIKVKNNDIYRMKQFDESNNMVEAEKFEFSEIKDQIEKLISFAETGNNSQFVEGYAHELKRMAAELNMNDIRILAFRIELAVRREDLTETKALINDLVVKIKDIENENNLDLLERGIT